MWEYLNYFFNDTIKAKEYIMDVELGVNICANHKCALYSPNHGCNCRNSIYGTFFCSDAITISIGDMAQRIWKI